MSSNEFVSRAEYDELVRRHEALLTKSITQQQTLSNAITKLEGQNALLRESNFVLVNTYEAQIEKLNKKITENESVIQSTQQELHTYISSTAQQTGDTTPIALYDQLINARKQITELHNKINEYEIIQTKNRADVVSYKNVIIELQDQITRLSQQQKHSLITEDLLTLVKLQLQIDLESASAVASTDKSSSGDNNNSNMENEVDNGNGNTHHHDLTSVRHDDTSITSIINERNLLRATKDKLHQDISELRQELSRLSLSVGESNESIPSSSETAQKHIDQLTQDLKNAHDKINALSSELILLHRQLRDTSSSSSSSSSPSSPTRDGREDTDVPSQQYDLETITQLTTSIEQYKQQHEEDEMVINKLQEQLERLTRTFDEYKQAASQRFQQLTSKYKEIFDEASKLQHTIIALKQQHARDISSLHNKFIAARTLSNRQRIVDLSAMKSQLDHLRHEMASIKQVICDSAMDTSSVTQSIVNRISQQNITQTRTLSFIKQRYEQEVFLRKRIFNELQELKGNIRVYARIRPLNDNEKQDKNNHGVIVSPRKGEIRVVTESNGKRTHSQFEFEHVFDPQTTQEELFTEVKDLIVSVMDGYNVCIFAYGQTGSGKTYTMEGYGNAPGVNPRALDLLFNMATSNDEWTWTVKLTLIEIYNEKVQDLLRENDNNMNLRIVQGRDGMEIPGCNIVTVNSAEEVQMYLTKGKKNRHVTRTDMNEHSSRSHLILSVYTTGYNKLTGVTVNGRLNLIDLAGSERISRSGVTGEALKEAQKINYSLSALGNVISARANKKDHIPYRDSALTYLLQDSLDKNSKTLMIVQLSPTLESAPETICSLRFAERVRKVELGKATKNQQIQPKPEEE